MPEPTLPGVPQDGQETDLQGSQRCVCMLQRTRLNQYTKAIRLSFISTLSCPEQPGVWSDTCTFDSRYRQYTPLGSCPLEVVLEHCASEADQSSSARRWQCCCGSQLSAARIPGAILHSPAAAGLPGEPGQLHPKPSADWAHERGSCLLADCCSERRSMPPISKLGASADRSHWDAGGCVRWRSCGRERRCPEGWPPCLCLVPGCCGMMSALCWCTASCKQ